MIDPSRVRNFSIIAHIDHGKSTLSDRILEEADAIDERLKNDQVLDSLEIEREKGITVKSAVVSFFYRMDGEEYLFNLIDTPGHVDFTYEVSRSLAACEGALLVVDAAQGVEAQTISNFFLALEANLTIVPVINKIDLPAANPEGVLEEVVKEFGLNEEDAVMVSAKNGINIAALLKSIVKVIPPPQSTGEHLRALIFDSFFDSYRGVALCVRVFSASIKAKQKVRLHFSSKEYEVEEVGWLGLSRSKRDSLLAGEVGYVFLGIKTVREIKIGDTILDAGDKKSKPLDGYKEVKPMVFAGVFPTSSEDYKELQVNIEKLALNDSALTFEKESSLALGFGFRCGFLGLLHMEIVQARLQKEFNTSIIITAPSVRYRVYLKDNKSAGVDGKEDYLVVDNPSRFPSPIEIEKVTEPFIKSSIITPVEYLGAIMQLVKDRRGIQDAINYLSSKRVEAKFLLPLGEIVFDFYDRLKSISRGYASFDYDFLDYREAPIVRVDILVNKESVDALGFLVHRDKARKRALAILEKLKDEIPRHMFQIPLQAAVGSSVVARENISPMRKDVTAKCYGGDISRKRKLLEKQKEGKRRMKSFGSVEIPNQAFLNVLKSE